MKAYKKLANKYEKKNKFINNTLGYYKKTIFFVGVSIFLVTVISLLFVQISKIEKAERRPTVVLVDIYTSRIDVEEYLNENNINFEYYPNAFSIGDYETIAQLQTYGVEKMHIERNYIFYYKSILYINADGTLKARYQKTANTEISTSLATIKENINKYGWA